ncbi:hypothetical protein PV336_16360 [Streptomyces sp. MI02-2A]|nr:hypothetical protein [Streptomyces sp. MI02-2A]MDX3260795.1 hypothetical protein [Streptomyces sp. MI02-2A]
MSLQSLLEYMGIETDLIEIEVRRSASTPETEPEEGIENDCS